MKWQMAPKANNVKNGAKLAKSSSPKCLHLKDFYVLRFTCVLRFTFYVFLLDQKSDITKNCSKIQDSFLDQERSRERGGGHAPPAHRRRSVNGWDDARTTPDSAETPRRRRLQNPNALQDSMLDFIETPTRVDALSLEFFKMAALDLHVVQ